MDSHSIASVLFHLAWCFWDSTIKCISIFFVPLYCWVVFLYMDVISPYGGIIFKNLFTSWQNIRVVSHLVLLWIRLLWTFLKTNCVHFSWINSKEWEHWVIWYMYVDFIRKCHTVFQSGYIIFHFYL